MARSAVANFSLHMRPPYIRPPLESGNSTSSTSSTDRLVFGSFGSISCIRLQDDSWNWWSIMQYWQALPIGWQPTWCVPCSLGEAGYWTAGPLRSPMVVELWEIEGS